MATASSSKTTTKKVGKENAPPARSTRKDETAGDGDEIGDEEEVIRKSSKPISKSHSSSKPQTTNGDEDDYRELKRKLVAVSADRDRYRSQRDTYSSQFEELTKTRGEDEGLLEKYKQKAEIQYKAQNDIIATQTALTEKLQAKVKDLEKALSLSSLSNNEREKGGKELPGAGGPFDDSSHIYSKSDTKEIKLLKDELVKLKNDNKAKDTEINELQKQCKTEIEYSKSLMEKQQLNTSTSKTNPHTLNVNSSSNISTTPEEAAKDAASLALYEDLSLLQIVNVKIKPVRIGNEETFNCVLCVNGKSLNFKLRCYTELDKSNPSSPKYVKSVHYQPELLKHESEEFIEKLGYFASEFVITRDQLNGFLAELKSKMGIEDDE